MSLANLSSLLKQSHIDDHEEILRAANASLKANKNDVEAQHVKAIALLKLDRFDDAAHAIESGDAKLKEQAKLEYAYALYKSGRRKEAAEIAHGSSDRGLQHIEAQALYGIEDFVKAAELYRGLSTSLQNDNEADLRTNSGAVAAQLEWSHQGQHVTSKKPAREDLEAYETAYNAACASIGRGELGQSEILLKRAKDICTSLQDLTDDEKESELLPITVQQLYVLVGLGKTAEAEQLARSINIKGLTDASSRYIARVNSIAATASASNPFLTQRQLAEDEQSFGTDRPFLFQRSVLERNHYAVDLSTSKFDGVVSTTQAKLAKESAPSLDSSVNDLSVFTAAARARNQAGKDALKQILPLLEIRPSDVGLVLVVVQLYVSVNNSSGAINTLSTFLSRLERSSNSAKDLDVRYAPALVGTLVSLYSSQRRGQQVRSELAKAATYWQRKSQGGKVSKGVTHLLKTAGAALSSSSDEADRTLARSIFSDLHEDDAQDRYAAAGLLATSDGSNTSDNSALAPLDRLINGIDVDALENAGVAQRSTPSAQTESRKRPATDAPVKKAKKLRKSKTPKDFDPNKKLDPERWLPLRDRSSYRPKGKKGKARQAMFSQGAVLSESENSRPATPGAETLKGKASAGGGANKKKKKKGKK